MQKKKDGNICFFSENYQTSRLIKLNKSIPFVQQRGSYRRTGVKKQAFSALIIETKKEVL